MRKRPLKPGDTAVIDPQDASQSAAVMPQTDEQKRLRLLIERRHPQYASMFDHWCFLEQTYDGGREWFDCNVFRYIKEGDREFNDRVNRAYRFNHTREVVDLIGKYLFKQNITRNVADAPESVKAFWNRATRNGMSMKDFARQISKKASIYGRIAVVVDRTAVAAGLSKAEEKASGASTYAYIVPPEQLLDYSYDDKGDLNWILIQEIVRDDADPMTASGDQSVRYRLWTKENWLLLAEEGKGKKKTVVVKGKGDHSLGRVPVILVDHIVSDDLYVSPSMIDDIAYLDRAVANYLSNLDAIIQDQTFSQLAMPAQNVMPGSDNYTTMLEMGTKRMFLFDGESGQAPFYLSPDVKQSSLLLEVINKIINEIYHTVGLAGERTKQDNALGIDNSSGVAKAYDFERVNALLTAKADSMELAEEKIAQLVALWNGDDLELGEESLISYPDSFDTRGLYDEFDIAAQLMLIEAPEEVRREQMRHMIDKLFPQLAKDLREKMEAELKGWPVDPMEQAAELAEINAKATAASKPEPATAAKDEKQQKKSKPTA